MKTYVALCFLIAAGLLSISQASAQGVNAFAMTVSSLAFEAGSGTVQSYLTENSGGWQGINISIPVGIRFPMMAGLVDCGIGLNPMNYLADTDVKITPVSTRLFSLAFDLAVDLPFFDFFLSPSDKGFSEMFVTPSILLTLMPLDWLYITVSPKVMAQVPFSAAAYSIPYAEYLIYGGTAVVGLNFGMDSAPYSFYLYSTVMYGSGITFLSSSGWRVVSSAMAPGEIFEFGIGWMGRF